MIRTVIICLLFLNYLKFTSAQIDSINVIVDSTDCQDCLYANYSKCLHPYRKVSAGKGSGGFIDSVRVCNQAILYDSSKYFLTVFSDHGITLLEGEFLGSYSNGILKEYDRLGRIIFEGKNEYRDPDKNSSLPYSYAIDTNKTYTYKNYKSTTPQTTREIIYIPDSRKYLLRLYNRNGEMIVDKKGKR